MNWFGRKSGRPALPRHVLGFGGGWDDVPQSYAARVREAMTRNPVASRAVRLVAESAGSAPLKVCGEALAALIAQPNPRETRAGFLEGLAAHLLLHGNAYVDAAIGAGGRPAELHALRPDRVTVEGDARGWPAAFLYRAGETAVRLPAHGETAGVLHIRMLNPTGDHYGLGCLAAAAGAVATHNAAAAWNRALLANAARPSGALVFEGEGALSPAQFERLRAEMEASFAGAGNAGRPMLLEGGLKWQALSMTPADMDFAGMHAGAARDIALAFGVPPMLLGLPGDNTYANYSEANRALWRLTVLPLVGRIAEALTHWLRHWWPDARVTIDKDDIPALSHDREILWAQVSAADFLSGEEKRRLLGIDAEDFA
ncbi:phage portal protein [Sphingosinicella soli]|uniref:phage portal protein n=1 Tax=Sphingosinicella soli TaxID=333708 RepID=UPI003C708DA2